MDINNHNNRLPPDPAWLEPYEEPPEEFYQLPQDEIHTKKVLGEVAIIAEEARYIEDTINDFLRIPGLDMLRQAAKRITVAQRKLKWEFEHLVALHNQLKLEVAALDEIVEAAGGVAAGPARGGGASGSGGGAGGSGGGGDPAAGVSASGPDDAAGGSGSAAGDSAPGCSVAGDSFADASTAVASSSGSSTAGEPTEDGSSDDDEIFSSVAGNYETD